MPDTDHRIRALEIEVQALLGVAKEHQITQSAIVLTLELQNASAALTRGELRHLEEQCRIMSGAVSQLQDSVFTEAKEQYSVNWSDDGKGGGVIN